ncbi:TPA: hypothetical protein ENX78_17845 [Candidatus Poribacteria bacterium]|nr:hypothetical protein [Candidatus Poribacteria bacterium]
MGNQTIAYFKTIVNSSKELNKKEKEILLRRLEHKTLSKIGRKYKLSAERIRQLEEKALFKFIKKACQLLLFD